MGTENAVETLANEPIATFGELTTLLEVLEALIGHPTPEVRINVCRALVRCVKLSSRLGDKIRDQTRNYVLLLLEGMENDTDWEVLHYVEAEKLTMDTLQEERP